jgi:hypothetical protein
MKKSITLALMALCCMSLLSGCLAFSLGGGTKTETTKPTVGDQLIDLKRAKDAGALTDAEFEAQKAKLLDQK